MQVKGLRNEGAATAEQARRDQDVAEARRWIFANWPHDDWHDIVHAIRDGVNAECLVRDQREHQIPLTGKIYDEKSYVDQATGATKFPPIKVDARRKGLRHGHREVRLESKRRLYALTLQRPEPSTFFDLQRAIIEDDGKDADGRWLCERCIPHPDNTEADRRHKAYPDGTGFDPERLPKWMPSQTEGVASIATFPPPEATVVIAVDERRQVSPGVFAPVHETGCSECGGAKYGKGFRHADGCSKSTKRVKAPT